MGDDDDDDSEYKEPHNKENIRKVRRQRSTSAPLSMDLNIINDEDEWPKTPPLPILDSSAMDFPQLELPPSAPHFIGMSASNPSPFHDDVPKLAMHMNHYSAPPQSPSYKSQQQPYQKLMTTHPAKNQMKRSKSA